MTATATRFTEHSSFRPWGIGLVLAVATLLVYGPVGIYPFVNYDDWAYVVQNPQVMQGLSWEGLAWAFRSLELSKLASGDLAFPYARRPVVWRGRRRPPSV